MELLLTTVELLLWNSRCKIPSEIKTPYSIIFSKTPEKITSLKFTHSAVLVLLLLLCSFTANSAHEYEEPTIKTMEDFSGYPINESHSTFHITLSSLSVDTQSLQIDELSTISNTPAPSVTRALYTDKDVLARRYEYAAGSAGYNKHEDDLLSVFLKKGCYSGFVELHIEQGPILEEEGVSIGIVTAIPASASIKVEFEGNGGHAGAVLMPNRNDAGLAAAELALAVERHVLESGSVDTVGTLVFWSYILEPSTASQASHIWKSTRDIDEEQRNIVIEKIHQSAIGIASKCAVSPSEFKTINPDPPALSDKSILEAMEASSKELSLTHKFMISRAYHDSLFMARYEREPYPYKKGFPKYHKSISK